MLQVYNVDNVFILCDNAVFCISVVDAPLSPLSPTTFDPSCVVLLRAILYDSAAVKTYLYLMNWKEISSLTFWQSLSLN